jgi:excinuclease ABC subunit B
MDRRRVRQREHNHEHGITPVSIQKSVDQVRLVTRVADARAAKAEEAASADVGLDRVALIEVLEQQMREAAAELDFEVAAQLRDQIFELKAQEDPERNNPRGANARERSRA